MCWGRVKQFASIPSLPYSGNMKIKHSDTNRSLTRALTLFRAIAQDKGETTFSCLSKRLNLPDSTAHRLVSELLHHGLVSRVGNGRYDIGIEVAALTGGRDFNDVLTRAARPIVRRVSREVGFTAHLGILEDGMVTYLVKATDSRSDQAYFTREGMQLEAYCSAVGKVLLAALSEKELDEYMSDGDFVSATKYTVTDSGMLRRDLRNIQKTRMAIDNREIAEDMMCIAVPLLNAKGNTIAALSISMPWSKEVTMLVPELSRRLSSAALRLGQNLGYSGYE